MKLITSFQNGKEIPLRFTCLGKNISPPFFISDLPKGTHRLAIILMDQDATPRPWIHWFLFNIPVYSSRNGEDSIPKGAIQGLANNNSFGYEGPCPRYFTGTHHYQLIAFALSEKLSCTENTDFFSAEKEIERLTIEKKSITGLCTRPKKLTSSLISEQ